MIDKSLHSASDIRIGQRAIAAVYKGRRLIWRIAVEIGSCFGLGYWVNEYPWSNIDGWIN